MQLCGTYFYDKEKGKPMGTYTILDETKKKQQAVGQAAETVEAAPAVKTDYTDYSTQYTQAMDRLSQLKQTMPTYDASYDKALQDLFDEIMNYEKFSYNSRDDMLYQAYKQSYTDAGRLAMQDTMGQAAALTGGYGSSYSQAVGEQQYGAYLQKLNEVLPETYGMAYQQYQDEKSGLQNRYGMVGQLADEEYQKYQDRLSSYYQELGYWQDAADTAYERQQYADQLAYDREQDAYKKQQDAYDRLAEMIMTLGYTPDAEDLAAAGMKDSEYQAYLNYYNSMNAPASVSSSGGRSSKKKTAEEESSLYDQVLSQAKAQIDKGKSVEVINGTLSNNAGKNGLSVNETREIMTAITNYAVKKGKLS